MLRRRALVKANEPIGGSRMRRRNWILPGSRGSSSQGVKEFLSEEINLVQEQDLRGAFQYAKGKRERDECTIEVLTNHRELHIESKSLAYGSN